MKIGFLMSPEGGSPLSIGLDRGLTALGHRVTQYHVACEMRCELMLIFNQAAHGPYNYPRFSNHLRCPIAFIDNSEYGWWTHEDSFASKLWNAFTPEAMAHDQYRAIQQPKLKEFLLGKSFPYFRREMYKAWNYPPSYHPIDYPLYLHSHCAKEPNRDEYLSRSLDFYLAWGESHPFRPSLVRLIREQGDRLRQEIYVIDDCNGRPRLPQFDCFAKVESARMSLSYDGYGYGSFRITETSVRTLLLQNRYCVHQHHPFVDGQHCIYYDVQGSGCDFKGTNLIEKIYWAKQHPEESFEIYRAGRAHCLEHHTETAVARYVLDVIQKHDYSKPTPL